jgi:tetratricopeptide (TPR) repeat protein
MGHSDYFAAFLLWPVFLGLALTRLESRWLGRCSALLGAIAILLTGSRGALVGLAIGAVIYASLVKPDPRIWGSVAALGTVAVGLFLFSPAGQLLRARAHWIGEDPAGGARLLLWRDSLRMAATHPWTGFGPDNFVAEFPSFQSVELAQAYPDFYHESPHNMWLDTLSGQGIIGLAAQVAIILLALWAGVRALKTKPELASGLMAGLVAVLAAHQFAVLTAANAFYLYLGCALLINLLSQATAEDRPVTLAVPRHRNFAFAGGAAVAVAFLYIAFQLVRTDFALASAGHSIAAGNVADAAGAYHRAVDLRDTGLTADLYFSRRFARAAADSKDVLQKLYLGQLAAGSASLATENPEGRPNAWFNLAELGASRSDTAAVETALRSAIRESPNWFKPHWALARLLFLQGRNEAAWEESQRAMQLNQKDPEVSSTLAPILSFRRDPSHSPSR